MARRGALTVFALAAGLCAAAYAQNKPGANSQSKTASPPAGANAGGQASVVQAPAGQAKTQAKPRKKRGIDSRFDNGVSDGQSKKTLQPFKPITGSALGGQGAQTSASVGAGPGPSYGHITGADKGQKADKGQGSGTKTKSRSGPQYGPRP